MLFMCATCMTQESISGWQAYSNIPGGGLEPRLAYLWAAIPSGWEGLLGVRSEIIHNHMPGN